MHNPSRLAVPAILLAAALAGCATQRPVLYPEARATGDPQAAIELCMQKAEAAGLDYHDGGEIPRRTAEGGVVGGATGAAAGAVLGDTGKGAAVGAAAGATRGLFRGLFAADRPDPVYRRFVDYCLRERGYEPIGWK
ncbi:hypothetical protein PC39_11222 [Salinisphaera sp. PC39]|uniref:glycine zipper family protein n=1 Tax=Salinisphaera sp. PC39 TaxID=1304156 RepID=UPI003341B8A5